MALALCGYVELPRHTSGGFDHGDVDHASGRVFVAHTANGTVEVIDGVNQIHLATLPDCPEGSGVLCVQELHLTFAAARGAGKVLVIDSDSIAIRREIAVGPKPNGLAWDPTRRQLLAADVEDFRARIFSLDGDLVSTTALSGRPRWCVYDSTRDRYLVNIREPAVVEVLSATTLKRTATFPISAQGPHGLDLDPIQDRAFVACDSGVVVVLDLRTGREIVSIPIAGEPDAIWYNRSRHKLYVAVGNPGVVDVLDTRTMVVDERIATEEGAYTTAFDPVRQILYVFLPRSCRAAIYAEG